MGIFIYGNRKYIILNIYLLFYELNITSNSYKSYGELKILAINKKNLNISILKIYNSKFYIEFLKVIFEV